MTWTYSATLATDRDKIRVRLGDIDTKNQLITDEAIAYVLTLHDDLERATYECAKLAIANPLVAMAVDRNGTGFSSTRSQRFQHLKDLIDMWERKSSLSAEITWTGSSVSAQETLDADTDYVGASFTSRQFDND